MAKVIITLKIMPESTESNLLEIEELVKEKIIVFAGETEMKINVEPIAFGLKCLKIMFVMDESIGSTEDLENNIKEINEINSVEVVDVRRTIG